MTPRTLTILNLIEAVRCGYITADVATAEIARLCVAIAVEATVLRVQAEAALRVGTAEVNHA